MSHKHLSSLPESHDAEDAWHHHTPDEHPQDAHGENVNVPQLLLYGTACFVIVVIAVVATTMYFFAFTYKLAGQRMEHYDESAPEDRKIQSEHNAAWQRAEAEVLKGLRGENGAFEKVIAQYGTRK
ncbi:MAG: hypothetical protein AB7K52_03425 [Phycisphaerales bacterium]